MACLIEWSTSSLADILDTPFSMNEVQAKSLLPAKPLCRSLYANNVWFLRSLSRGKHKDSRGDVHLWHDGGTTEAR